MKNNLIYKILIILLAVLLIALLVNSNKKNSDEAADYDCSEGYRELIKNVKYKKDLTYVIGHESPDSDTVSAAIAYANLLNELGIEAKAVTSAKVNKETQYYFDYFGIEAPEILTDASGKQFVLVDHSEYSQAIDNMKDARIVGIIDHHGIGDVYNSEIIYVRSEPIGSTATLVYQMYKECNVVIDKDIARILLMGLLSDTDNLTKSNVTKVDEEAYDELIRIGEVDDVDALYTNMRDAYYDYSDLSSYELLIYDYKEYEVNGITFALGVLSTKDDEQKKKLTDRVYDALVENYDKLNVDMVFMKIENETDDNMYMVAYGDGAVETLDNIYHTYDGNRYFVFDKSMSRKKKLVPKITAYLSGTEE